MFDIEKQKKNFKNHIAKFTDYGNIKILDFKDPNTSNYRIRFLFEEDYCRLHISGDLGELIATNYNNMTYEKFSDFVNSIGYFESKIDCHSRDIYYYDEERAKQDIKERLEDCGCLNDVLEHDRYDWETDEDKLEEFYEGVLADFSEQSGIGSNGYDALSEYLDDVFEFVGDIGKVETGILNLYMLAFKVAQGQLKEGYVGCCDEKQSKLIVEQTAAEQNNGWIPCSERLPEESLNSVLGWDEYRERCCLVQYVGGRWILGNDIDSVKIIAWQPLPEPYQPDGYPEPKRKTNFDYCCQSAEIMAQVIDIAKCGWTKEEIINWLQSEAKEI